jgi:hypothetical protein
VREKEFGTERIESRVDELLDRRKIDGGIVAAKMVTVNTDRGRCE